MLRKLSGVNDFGFTFETLSALGPTERGNLQGTLPVEIKLLFIPSQKSFDLTNFIASLEHSSKKLSLFGLKFLDIISQEGISALQVFGK